MEGNKEIFLVFVGGKALSALGDGNWDADRRCADEPIEPKNTKIPNGNC